MSDRDRLAADLEEAVPHADCLGKGVCASVRRDWALAADRLLALGVTYLDEGMVIVPADLKTRIDAYILGKIDLIDEERLARAFWAQEPHYCDPAFHNCAAAIAKAYREDADATD